MNQNDTGTESTDVLQLLRTVPSVNASSACFTVSHLIATGGERRSLKLNWILTFHSWRVEGELGSWIA